MDTTWIQVFVLTLSECVAPAGKTACQDHEIEMQFLSRAECEVALQELVTLKTSFKTSLLIGRSRDVRFLRVKANHSPALMPQKRPATRMNGATSNLRRPHR